MGGRVRIGRCASVVYVSTSWLLLTSHSHCECERVSLDQSDHAALMEIPEQYKAISTLKLLGNVPLNRQVPNINIVLPHMG